MSDQDEPMKGDLVPAGRRDVAPVPAANPLVSRGMAELAGLREVTVEGDRPPDPEAPSPKRSALIDGLIQEHRQKAESLHSFLQALPKVQGRHPFDLPPSAEYRTHLRLLKLALRIKELGGLPKDTP